MKKWNLNSWTKYPAKHLPVYQDKKELDLVLSKVKKYPPLVFAGETSLQATPHRPTLQFQS